MYGGTLLDVTGPCFAPGDAVVCRFGSSGAAPLFSSGSVSSPGHATCVTPFSQSATPAGVPVFVSRDNGTSYR